MTQSKKQTFRHYFFLLLGAAILAFGLFNVHAQSRITEGGVLGMTLLLYNWFGISPGISEICIDIVCYLVGFKLLGKDFLKMRSSAVSALPCFTIFLSASATASPICRAYRSLPRSSARCLSVWAWDLSCVRAVPRAAMTHSH